MVADTVARFVPVNSIDEQWDLPGLEAALVQDFGVQVPLVAMAQQSEELDAETIEERVQEAVRNHFEQRETQLGADTMRMLEKHIMLNVLDQNWKEHLARMDYLRQGIHLRGYAQKQPKQEYKKEAFELFSDMLEKVKREVVTLLARVRIRSEEEIALMEAQERAAAEAQARQMQFQHAEVGGQGADEEAAQVQAARNPMPSPTSAATIRARAAAARSTSTAMDSWPEPARPYLPRHGSSGPSRAWTARHRVLSARPFRKPENHPQPGSSPLSRNAGEGWGEGRSC